MATGTRRVRCLIPLALLLGAVGVAEASSVQDEPILKGPSVADGSRPSLVQIDFNGNFYRVEGRPEVAALRLLEIEPERRERAIDAARERIRSLEVFLVEHIDDVRAVTDQIAAGDRKAARARSQAMHREFEPDAPRAPLLEAFRPVLSAMELEELARIVDEYWAAWIEWELRGTDDPTARQRKQTRNRLVFQLFQSEVTQAYNSSLRPYRERLERIYDIADPTPEQRAAIRSLVIDHIRATRLESSPEQRAQLARSIYGALDEERRIKLFELLVAGL